MALTVKLHAADNVAVARVELRKGTLLPEIDGIELHNDIPAYHKIAVRALATGDNIVKYNQIIGSALQPIAAGEHIHVHNCGIAADFAVDRLGSAHTASKSAPVWQGEKTFMGYKRRSGKVGTRNYIGILTSVNCSASVAKALEHFFSTPEIRARFPNVDGVVAFTHGSGCGMGRGDGFDILSRVYEGYATHANFSSVLMIGLGCEVMQVADIMGRSGLVEGDDFVSLVIQEQGGSSRTVEAGKTILESMLARADQLRREPCPISELCVALQCGGSDALSGITANPSLGAAMDLLAGQGGTAVLAETPEIFGAEHLLMQRAASVEIAATLQGRIDWWLEYTAKNGVELNNNPSPGNKAGGLTTILEKSLGAQAKSGTSKLNGVYQYAQPIDSRGLVFMDSPGYDPVSVTGQIASGANMVCFTTGRGSVYGAVPAPSIKLATNTPLFERMDEDMDFNCGPVFDEGLSIAECGEMILNKIIATASGERTKSEMLGYGRLEFLPWNIGAVI
ncbi:MAG: altronate dehydratase family protein [Pseudomonadales bacterium]|nr:altronate dehydratase family protein [Pseudomonadales bacterium]MDP4640766.1 altronate dehydratase family protein [Pseudomonadales bacterium]MDP4765880.1 altronate dehydratase family protein [Pseudomonadales bacterium]MDP4911277.1 altronate dehydratase family protein [Pseudomonadales bacterium]MDP5059472.1 altronate dehydratase family protein [Pseudomonadales bacterium]